MPSLFIVELSVEGAVVALGEAVESLLEPMPLVRGDVVSVVLGAVLGDVLGDVVVGAFGGDGVVFAELGVPADEFAPPVVPLEPPVCAYTTLAASATATLAPTAMDLKLLMKTPGVGGWTKPYFGLGTHLSASVMPLHVRLHARAMAAAYL